MKRLLAFLILLALTACMPAPLTLVPVDTAVALTMEAMPKTETPTREVPPSETPTIPTPQGVGTPGVNFSIPGAGCVPQNTQRTKALVTRILDGSTIEVVIGYDIFQVRYIGMDAPNMVQPIEWQGPQAYAANERLVSGQIVTLVKDISEVDPDGKLPRYVFAGNVFVNYDLIRQGFSKVASVAPDVACESTFLAAQAEAQAGVIGVWIPIPTPTPTITLTPTITIVPTETLRPVCNCDQSYTCKDFPSTSAAQACFDYCRETYDRLVLPDKNGNGKVCEGGAG